MKLSICIATLNRAELIGKSLESIIPQLTDEVEVVVIDGNSADNTEEVVKSFGDKVRYYKLLCKGGVDADYDKAVEFASGEYCWLFTDDDLMAEGAIDHVLSVIKSNTDCSIVVVDFSIYDRNIKHLLSRNVIGNYPEQTTKENHFYSLMFFSNTFRFFDFVSPGLPFIGCVVFNRALWMSRDRKKYYGSLFIHIGTLFQKHCLGLMIYSSKVCSLNRLGYNSRIELNMSNDSIHI